MDNNDIKTKLVVSCFLNLGESIVVDVSKSFSLMSDTTDYRIEDARVQLIYNGSLVADLEHKGGGRYQGPLVAESNGHYQIKVSHPLFPDAAGADSIPEEPVIVHSDSIPVINGFPTIYMSLEDPDGPSYFAMKAIGYNKVLIRDSTTLEVIDSIPQTRVLNIQSLEKIFDSDKDLKLRRLPFFTFTDQFFAGGGLDMSLRLYPDELDASLYQTRVDSVTLELRHITSSYYHFIRSYNHAQPIFGGPFGSFEPIEGNITGGYGVVAGCSKLAFKLPVKWE